MLIADVFDVILIDSQTNDVIATTTLQTANLEVAVQENEVRGGKGNQLLGVLHAKRDININLTDAEFRYDWLARQLGQNIATGAGVAYAMPKWYTVSGTTTLKITLDETPVGKDGMVIVKASGELIPQANYTINGKDVTFTSGAAADDKVEVRTYKYATAAQTEQISIDNSVFAKGVKAILETVEINGESKITHKLQYQFDQAVPTGNFTINTASERTASTQQFNMKVIKPQDSQEVGRVIRIPVAG